MVAYSCIRTIISAIIQASRMGRAWEPLGFEGKRLRLAFSGGCRRGWVADIPIKVLHDSSRRVIRCVKAKEQAGCHVTTIKILHG